ncbi:MAG TPA: reverse transcriptase family protein [Gaiellaceae bacterium]|jgi:hypothetical protein
MWDDKLVTEARQVLADAFLAGEWTRAGLEERARSVVRIAPRARWLRPLIDRTLQAYREPPYDRRRELHAWLDEQLTEISYRARPPEVTGRLLPVARMARRRWPVPELATVADLAAFLDLHVGELSWLADTRGWERDAALESLRHYRYRWIRRPGGAPRPIEAPKRHLRELQRRVLHQILDLIPPHPDAQGFRRGHSALTNARRHTGQGVVIGFDLEDFFASIEAGRIYGIFRGAGYPEEVAHRLTGLCTNVIPRHEWLSLERPVDAASLARHRRLGQRLAEAHLPQGAPTSPALANLAAYRLDCRLAGLASATDATYSRYADDLSFSGGKRLLASATRFRALVAEIVNDEGFRLNDRKSRLATSAGRQTVTGIVVNERPNLERRHYDKLKAIVHDAARHGVDHANRADRADFRAHLLGRIVWAEQLNPIRGAKLRAGFDRISWPP